MTSDAALNSAIQAAPMRYTDMARRDISQALRAFPDLHPSTDLLEYPDRTRRPVVTLAGTVPVNYKGATYNIPLCLYLWDTHPYHGPVCYVRPTRDMMVKPSQFVDQQGKIYLPYLSEWQHPRYDLQGLLQVMVITFQDNCPVFSTAAGRSTQWQSPQPPAASTGYTPYPSQPQGYMPMPSVAGSGSNQYPPQTTPYPVSTAYSSPPYPSYPSYTGTNTTPSGYPYPSSNATTTHQPYQSQGSTGSQSGTIQPEHIRASLLSAIEDRLKRRLRDTLGTAHAELQSIRRTREELNNGEQRLKSMMSKLGEEQTELETQQMVYFDKKEEIEKILAHVPADNEMKIDDAIDTSTPLHRQLFNSFVQDNAIEDGIYYLGQSLKRGELDLDTYLKHVRKMSRDQFSVRATMQKCRLKAGLSI